MDSFKIICTTLAQAEPDWWKYTEENTSSPTVPVVDTVKRIDDGRENDDDDDGEIDLDAM